MYLYLTKVNNYVAFFTVGKVLRQNLKASQSDEIHTLKKKTNLIFIYSLL